MWNDILSFLQNTGFALIANDWRVVVMLLISFFLLYLAIAKKYEPLLLLPIAFGMLLTNLPGAGLFHSELWTAFLDELFIFYRTRKGTYTRTTKMVFI